MLRFYIEPQFSYVQDGIIYGSASSGNLRTIDQFDFATGTYSRLLDLETLAPNLSGTFIGAVGSSAGPVERIMAFFGGTSQDRHYYLAVFDKANPSNRRLLDTRASTLDGRPTNVRLNFLIHAAAIDRSGRYVTLYPTGGDRGAPRNAAPNYLWDTATDVFTELPSIEARSNGHDAFGYGVRVNQDCCTTGTYDAAQWQLRSLAAPLVTQDVISPVLLPKEVSLADHPSWHNAQRTLATCRSSPGCIDTASIPFRGGRGTMRLLPCRRVCRPGRVAKSGASRTIAATCGTTTMHPARGSGTRQGRTFLPMGGGCCSRRTGRRHWGPILAGRKGNEHVRTYSCCGSRVRRDRRRHQRGQRLQAGRNRRPARRSGPPFGGGRQHSL